MDGQPAEPGDAVRRAALLEPDHPGPLAVDLDQQPPEAARLALRPLDLRQDPGPVERAAAAQERLRLLAAEQLDEPVDVARPSPAAARISLAREVTPAAILEPG